MEISEWLPWRCWVCQGGEFDESQQEVKVPQIKNGGLTYAAPNIPVTSPRGNSFLGRSDGGRSPRSSSLQEEEERARLRELMKIFVTRGMQGVECELLDEASGTLRLSAYRIDERLRSLAFQPSGPSQGENDGRSADRHIVKFAEVSEVLRTPDADTRLPEASLRVLSEEQRRRLVVLIHGPEWDKPRHVAFLEASEQDRQKFLTCVRILRRYMDEQGNKEFETQKVQV